MITTILSLLVLGAIYGVYAATIDYNDSYINEYVGHIKINKHNDSFTMVEGHYPYRNQSLTVKQLSRLISEINLGRRTSFIGYEAHSPASREVVFIGCQTIDVKDINKTIKYLNKHGYTLNYIN